MLETQKELMSVVEYLSEKFKHVGSRAMWPDDANRDTDYDFLVLAEDDFNREHMECLLKSRGFKTHAAGYKSNPENSEPFIVMRCFVIPHVDIILTSCQYFYNRFAIAHEEAIKLDLRDKAERLVHFQDYLYGEVKTREEMQDHIDDHKTDSENEGWT